MTDQLVTVEIDIYVRRQVEDWDNYAKAICDGLNGIAWIDDRQVVEGGCGDTSARRGRRRVRR